MLYPNLQSGLFTYKLSESGITLQQASLLFSEKLLSFDPEKRTEYQSFEIDELKFLKILYFDSGLPVAFVKGMLNKLAKPYIFSFNKIYWDYGIQNWKELPQEINDYIKDNLREIVFDKFDEFLDVIEKSDVEELSTLKDSITNRLERLKNLSNEHYSDLLENKKDEKASEKKIEKGRRIVIYNIAGEKTNIKKIKNQEYIEVEKHCLEKKEVIKRGILTKRELEKALEDNKLKEILIIKRSYIDRQELANYIKNKDK